MNTMNAPKTYEKIASNTLIRDWYISTYPTDDLGEEIKPELTFYDLIKALEYHHDVYDLLGVGDSIIRERAFQKLSEIMECSYEDIYNQWLSKWVGGIRW